MPKKSEPKKQPANQTLLVVLLGALLLTICSYLVHGFYEIKGLNKSVVDLKNQYRLVVIRQNELASNTQHASSSNHSNNDALKNSRVNSEDTIALKTKVKNIETRFQSTNHALQQVKKELKSFTNTQQKQNELLSGRLEIADKLLLETLFGNGKYGDAKPFSYFESSDWILERDNYLGEIRENGLLFGVVLDAKEGRDTAAISKTELFPIDSMLERSVEIFNFVDGEHDKIYVLAPGFTQLEDNALTIKGDPDIDEVILDGCLKWFPIDNSNNYEVLDIAGESRRLLLPDKLSVTISNICIPDYTTLHTFIRTLPASQRSTPNKKDQKEKPNTTFKITSEKNAELIKIYQSWLKKAEHPLVKEDLQLLITAMDKGVLPTMFPRVVRSQSDEKYLLEPLNFNSTSFPITELYDTGTCAKASTEENEIIRNSAGTGIKIDCAHGDQIYSLSDKHEIIDDSWGNDIVFPRKGRDTIDLGWGQDIAFLSNNWGEKTITKTCHRTSPKSDNLYYSELIDSSYIGMGFSIKKTKDAIFINGVFEGAPAAKAGLAKGDRIYKINDQDISTMDITDILSLLKGSKPASVELEYYSYEHKRKMHAKIYKEVVDRPQKLRPRGAQLLHTASEVKENWPYTYNSFIVFGSEIKKEDIEITGKGELWNTATGDTLKYATCFELVYMSSTPE